MPLKQNQPKVGPTRSTSKNPKPAATGPTPAIERRTHNTPVGKPTKGGTEFQADVPAPGARGAVHRDPTQVVTRADSVREVGAEDEA